MEHTQIPSGLYDEHCVHTFPCVGSGWAGVHLNTTGQSRSTSPLVPDLWIAGCWLADCDDRDPWCWICVNATQNLSGWLWHSLIAQCMLSGATAYQLGHLQRLQNRAVRLITGVGIRGHITPVLKELHWLPVELRIHFKVLLYIFKALRGQAPQYLGQLCCYKQRPSHLRQPRDFLLQVPLTQRSATEAAFSVQGPVLWNKLPHDFKRANSVNIFKNKLKTHFFRIYLANDDIYS